MKIFRFGFFWFLAVLCEAPVGAFLFSLPHATFVYAVLGHAASVLCFFVSVPKGNAGWFSKQRLWARTLVMFSAFLPLLGWLFCGFLFFYIYKNPESQHQLDVLDEKVFQPTDSLFSEFLPVDAVSREKMIRDQIDLIPLADILVGDDLALKRGAIEKLALLKNPESLQILLRHRSDDSPEVRFYVTSVLTRIKKEYDDELEAAKLEMQKDVYKVSSRTFLAKIYWQYGTSGLVDEATAHTYIGEAEYHLRYVIETPYASVQAYELLLALLLHLERWGDASVILEKMSAHPDASKNEVLKMEADIFYKKGEYSMMKPKLKALLDLGETDLEWVTLARFWGC